MPTQYKSNSSRLSPPSDRRNNNQFNFQSVSGLSVTHLQNYPHSKTSRNGQWRTNAGKATFMGNNDMSHGISRATAYDMQSEAEMQLRHQIRDTV